MSSQEHAWMLWQLVDKGDGGNPQNDKNISEAANLLKDIDILIDSGYTWWSLEIFFNQYHYGYVILKPPEMLEGKHWKNQYNFFLRHQAVDYTKTQT